MALLGIQPETRILPLALQCPPELDGFEVMHELQSREARLPVLIVSARRAVDDVRKAIGLGADAFLTKPFDDKLLLERVERLVNPPRLPGNFFII